jgi:DNA polymerase-1
MDKFLIIDGNSLINRAFYALPLLSNSKGEVSNAVYGFVNILTKAINEQKPKYIAVAFDYGKKTFRNNIYADYKITRKGMPVELGVQMPILKNVLDAMNIKYFEQENIEADDLIGTLAQVKGVQKLLLSGDRDLFQLINKDTFVWFTKKGISEVEIVDEKNLNNLMGLTPSQVIDYKALRGDTSDNIPGVAGIGEKGAMDLLQKYNTLGGIYENIDQITGKLKEKLIDGKDMAYISYQLATINKNVDIKFNLEDLTYTYPYNKKTFDIFKQYEFNSLLRRKDIFQSDVFDLSLEDSKTYLTVKVDSQETLNKIIDFIKEENRIAFDFSTSLTISCSPNAIYVFEKEISMFSNDLSTEHAMSALREVFENPLISKICLDWKKHSHIFQTFNVDIKGDVFDISLARYLLGEDKKIENEETPTFFYTKKELILKMKELGVYNLYQNIELPLVSVLFEMEKNGLLLDLEELDTLNNNLKEELNIISEKVQELAGERFNLNSPKQLSNILFNKLQLKAFNNKKLSTNVEILMELEHQHEIIPYLLRYRKIQKLLTTYVESFNEIAKKNNGYIRTIFNQTQTATGRLSSSDPNLQNLPIRDDEGKQLRKVFISRFKKGKIVSADYNQIELRLMAHYSQDKNLINAYARNEDIHSRTASSIFGVPMDSITPEQRRLAKTVNFGIIYGISDYGLSQSLGTSVAKAKDYITRYFEVFPRVKEYIGESIELAKERGYASTLFGRVRFIPDLKSENFATRKFGERVAINMPLQGTASDIIKIAMINVSRKLKENNLETKLVLQIHDELILDCPENELQIASKILKESMENVVKLSVPLPVDLSYGDNLYESK